MRDFLSLFSVTILSYIFTIMIEKIEITVRYSVDDYVRGVIFSQYRERTFNSSFLFIVIAALLFYFVTDLFIQNAKSIWEFDYGKIPIFLMLAVPFSYLLAYLFKDYHPIAEKLLRKQYDSSLLLQEVYKISFDADGIKSESDSFNSKINWNGIVEVDQTDEDFYFFTSPGVALFIPKRVFTAEQQAEIRNLVKIKLGDRVKF